MSVTSNDAIKRVNSGVQNYIPSLLEVLHEASIWIKYCVENIEKGDYQSAKDCALTAHFLLKGE